MKINIFTASMGKGGSERVLSYLVHEMIQQGDEVSLHLLIDSTVAYPLPEQVSVHYLRKHKNKAMNLFYWIRSIRRVVRQTDVVISFAYKINIIVYIASLGLKKKLIFSERNHPKYDGRSRLGLLICNFVYQRIDKLVVQNKSIQQCFNQKVIENSVIIPNPVEKVIDFEYMPDSNLIIAIGRLVKQKNFHLLIEAFSFVVKEEPKLQLVIFGEGPLRNELEELVIFYGLSSRISLPGVVDDIFTELSKSALFVQTSHYEGQSNALLEAMVHGLPVVSTDYEGVEEVIEHGVNGWIVKADENILAETILAVMYDQEMRTRVSIQTKKLATKISTDVVFETWKRILN